MAAAQAEAATVRGGELLAVLGAVPTAAHGAAGTGGRAEPEALVDAWASGDPSRVLLVGLFEGETVGVGTGHLVEGHSRHVGRIECCYVEPEARQVGVGGALIGGLLDWFSEQGCTDVDAVALPGDRATKQLSRRPASRPGCSSSTARWGEAATAVADPSGRRGGDPQAQQLGQLGHQPGRVARRLLEPRAAAGCRPASPSGAPATR